MKLFKKSPYKVHVDKESIDKNEETFNIFFDFSDDVRNLVIDKDTSYKIMSIFDSISSKVLKIYKNHNIKYDWNNYEIEGTYSDTDIDSILEPIPKFWNGEEQRYKIKQDYWDSTIFPEIMNALNEKEKSMLAARFKATTGYNKYIKSDKTEDIIYNVLLNQPMSLHNGYDSIIEDNKVLSVVYKEYTGKDISDLLNNTIEELRKLSYEAINSVISKTEYKDMFEPLSKNSKNGVSYIEINVFSWLECWLNLRPTEDLLNKLKTKELKKKQLISIMTDMGNEIEKF